MKQFQIKGISNLAKFIESLRQADYTFLVHQDDYQADQPVEESWFSVAIADNAANEYYELVEDKPTLYLYDSNDGSIELVIGDIEDNKDKKVIRLHKGEWSK